MWYAARNFATHPSAIMKTTRPISNFFAIGYAVAHPSTFRKALRAAVRQRYEGEYLKESTIETLPFDEVCDANQIIRFQNCGTRIGNVSSFELMVLATAIASYRPHTLIEIGTFDGNTTLQMALNSPDDATVHTIDLPPGVSDTHVPTETVDERYITDERKLQRKYQGTNVAHKVRQHFGDSVLYDFSLFTGKGPIDFAFIDGGHSYECVKSDTEKTLQALAPRGVIFWHDFNYKTHPGVFCYLCDLSKKLRLVHIADTNLVALMPGAH